MKIQGRIRRAALAVSIAWLGFLLEPLSGLGLGFPGFAVDFAVTALLALATLFVVLAARPVSRLALLAWSLYPLAASALVGLFIGSQSPANPLFRLRFAASRGTLEEAVRDAASGKAGTGRRGLFFFARVEVSGPELRLVEGGCGVVDQCGLLYSRTTPAARGKTRLKRIDGPWYHLYSVF